MKIITVNLPEPFLTAMEKLISEYSLYPSRSELIRVAVREFLIKELKVMEKFEEYRKQAGEELPKPPGDMRKMPFYHDYRTKQVLKDVP